MYFPGLDNNIQNSTLLVFSTEQTTLNLSNEGSCYHVRGGGGQIVLVGVSHIFCLQSRAVRFMLAWNAVEVAKTHARNPLEYVALLSFSADD